MLGNVLLALAAVLVLLLGAALLRTLWLRRRWPAVNAGALPVLCSEAENARYGAGLAELVKVPTVTARNESEKAPFAQLHGVMETLFPQVFAALEKYEWEGNLLLRWPGKDSSLPGILLMGHQDVVPAPPEGWRHPPFAAVIEDGTLYGRGALDCKCTVYAEFQAVEELLAAGFVPPCDVYLSSSVDEETGGSGARALVRELQHRGVRLALVLDEGGSLVEGPLPGIKVPYAMMGVMEKGHMDVRISAKSAGGHSSTPPRNTPMARLAAFICEVERRAPFDRRFSPLTERTLLRLAPCLPFPLQLLLSNLWLFRPLVRLALPRLSPYGAALLSTTCAFTMCGGSDAANVIPNEAWIVANLRVSGHENCEDSLNVLKRLGKKYDLDFTVVSARDASACVDPDGYAFRFVESCVRECYPGVGIAPYLITGGTDCRYYEPVSDGNIRFCPLYMTNQQMESCHAVNENVTLWALGDAVKFYEHLLRRWQPETKGEQA